MVIRKIGLTIILVFTAFTVFAQSGLNFTYDFCTDARELSDANNCFADSNRFFVFGSSTTDTTYPRHGYIASFDYSGQLLWTKKILHPGRYNSYSTYQGIIKSGIDRYATIGTIINTGEPWRPYVYVFNGNGDSINYWEYDTDTICTRYFSAIVNDGSNFIAAGTIFCSNPGPTPDSASLWLCKFDSVGNIVWDRKYFTVYPGIANVGKIALSSDSLHYIVAVNMKITNNGYAYSCILKLDTTGNIIWLKTLPKPYISENDIDIVTNHAGGYYFVSSVSLAPPLSDGTPDSSNIYYGKLDENGDTVWTRNFRGNFGYCYGYQIECATDKKHLVILAGPAGGNRAGAIKIDTSGNVVWHRFYKHIYGKDWWMTYDNLRSLSVTPDNRYLMTGSFSDSLTQFKLLSWMIRTDSNGCRHPNDSACAHVSVSVTKTLPENSVEIYPNPVNDILHIDLLNNEQNMLGIITDITGRAVMQLKLLHGKNTLSTNSLTTGLYFVKIYAGNELINTTKLVK